VDQNAKMQGWDMVRKALDRPDGEAGMSAEQLHKEILRLKARLEQVQARGPAYRKVDFSADVRELLARLEAGTALSGYVH
jgi:hypothetical protein